ncbi:putative ribonuclease H-like domain-containing protein [Tanacetum coccineum]
MGCHREWKLFQPATQTTKNADGSLTTPIPGPVTADEKTQKKNDVKAKSFRRLNKPDLDTISFDDLYNNFKIVEQEVKETTNSSSSSSSQNMAFMSSPSSTNEVNTAYRISTTNTQASLLALKLALLVINYMADDEVPINMALMAFSDSEKKNKVLFCEQLAVLKRDISYKDSEISMLKSELEKLKQEKETNQLKIEKFNNASKSQDKLIGSQIIDNSRKGVGFLSYNAVPPPPTGLFSPPNLDLSNSGLEEFQQPEFEGYGPKASKSVIKGTSNYVRESPDAPLVKELVSDDKLEKKTIFPTVAKIEFVRPKQQEKPVKLTAITIKGKGLYLGIIIQGPKAVNTARPNSVVVNAVRSNQGHPQKEDQGYVDSGYSRHMTGNIKGTLKTGKLDFKDVYFVKELQFNLFSVSPTRDNKNNVLFTDTGCFVLSSDFKLADESQILLKVPRKNNMYNVDMKNIVPKECLNCLIAKATLDESMLWHRRLGHVNFKTINKHVKENLMRGLTLKCFVNDQTCVAYPKGKQHKASCKSKIQNSITQPLFMLYLDLFGPTFVSSLMNKKYCRVVTGDYSKFTWVFFLATKDETSSILKTFITKIENLVDKKVKIIRCDNRTEFKNKVMSTNSNDFVDSSLFDSSSKNVSNDEPQPSSDARKKDDEITTAPLEATHAEFFDDESELDISNIATTYPVRSSPNTRIHKDHSLDHVIGDVQSSVQTRRMINEQGFISVVYEGETHEDLYTCLFACFLSQEEPKKVIQALKDPSWIEVIQEELLQFKLQQVWTLVDLPYGKRAIGTKWVYRNNKDERVARIEAIRLFLAYASFKDFVVYQIDVKSAFLYVKIKEEVYACQPLGFQDLEFPDKVYKRGQIDKTLFIKRVKGDILLVQLYVDDIIFRSTRKEMCTQFEKMMHKSQDKYVEEILKKFGFSTVKTTSTPMETSKLLLKDAEAEDVDVHLYRLMIGSLMYQTASRPDIMFFDSPFDLEASTDSDYACASLDRKSTTGGCQFLGGRLISRQCKKKTIVANSTTEAEYVSAASCCGQTKHIEIRHIFIRDSNEKKLIQMIKIHTEHNVADLLTKAFDVGRFQYLVASIGMLNL